MAAGTVQGREESRLQQWQQDGFGRRLWKLDYTLWATKPDEITNRLGWLDLPHAMQEQIVDLAGFADQVRADGFRHALLLGMGGSSLAPEVFQSTFGNAGGYPQLHVLDSTHPDAVRNMAASVDLSKTLFIVSSKSGTTLEPLSFFRYFSQQVKGNGSQFVAITDPGTSLEKLAKERGFRRVFNANPNVGGRYSALTHFGLVPAAVIGVDLRQFLERAQSMADACGPNAAESKNPGLVLGAALGELTLAGRDKITFVASPQFAALPGWLEQLIAESTGKDGKGIVPVAGELLADPGVYGNDRVFVYLQLAGSADDGAGQKLKALEAAGYPVIRITAQQVLDLGAEFFRWEVAVVAAGAVIGIQPFNQPDVELAKDLSRKAMSGQSTGSAQEDLVPASQPDSLRKAVAAWLGAAKPGDYVGIHAYLAPTEKTTARLTSLQQTLRNKSHLATTLGYGPRFLHSTGQLHKGGPNTGLFVQFVDQPAEPVPVPETDFTFARIIQAQAFGDYQVLKQRGRRLLRVQLGADVAGGLRRFEEFVRG